MILHDQRTGMLLLYSTIEGGTYFAHPTTSPRERTVTEKHNAELRIPSIANKKARRK